MSKRDVEFKLADQYLEELDKLIEQLAHARASDGTRQQNAASAKLNEYSLHVQQMRLEYARDPEFPYYESAIYATQADIALFSQGIINRVARESAKGSNDFAGELFFNMVAGNEDSKNIRRSIELFGIAIAKHDTLYYRYRRAKLHMAVNQIDSAMEDIKVLLAHPDNDEIYLEARKLQNEIEMKQAKQSSNKGDCFIATAVYGSATSWQVETLRDFRDSELSRYWLGQKFIAAYYRWSPSVAARIKKNGFSAKIVRTLLLDPFVRVYTRLRRC